MSESIHQDQAVGPLLFVRSRGVCRGHQLAPGMEDRAGFNPVLVIGGGPAGSTAAGLLVRQGFQVSLAERERFPRYHIGESILPAISPILDLLGAKEKVTAHGVQPKGGTF